MPDPGARPETASLRGLRVLVARPAHQAEALCAMIEAAGGNALRLPMIEIVSVESPAAAASKLERAKTASFWIFTSTNAVRYAAGLVSRPWPRVAAVGASTAAALHELGVVDVLVPPSGDGAAALLAHAKLGDVRGQHIVLVSGEQPLPELEQQLRAREARVELVPVYRRRGIEHAADTISAAVATTDVAILPSADALQHLVRLTPAAARSALLDLQLALPSPRVVEKALQLGFRRRPWLPQRVSDEAYVDAMLRYRNSGEQDRHSDCS